MNVENLPVNPLFNLVKLLNHFQFVGWLLHQASNVVHCNKYGMCNSNTSENIYI